MMQMQTMAMRNMASPSSGGNYTAEAKALFAAMTTKPNPVQKKAIDTFIKTLKTSSIWSTFDIAYILNTQAGSGGATDGQESLFNIVNPATHKLLPSTPTPPVFTAKTGWVGAAGAYLDTQYNPTSNKVNFAQNLNSFGVYITNNAAQTSKIIGRDSTVDLYITAKSAITNLQVFRNNNGSSSSAEVATSIGLHSSVRTASSEAKSYLGNTEIVTNTSATTGILNGNVYLLSSSGTAADDTVHNISFAWLGGALTPTQLGILDAACATLVSAMLGS